MRKEKRWNEERGCKKEKGSPERGRPMSGQEIPPRGLWELPCSPSRWGGEGQKYLGPSWIFFSSFYWRKQNSPHLGENPKTPPWGPQNSPRTSQNLWEGSFYTFLQPTPNPKISEYLEVLGWKFRFSCVKGGICIPKIRWGNWRGTCEQEDDEGAQGEINIPEVRKKGGRGGSQTPEDLGGIGCLPIPVLEGLQ